MQAYNIRTINYINFVCKIFVQNFHVTIFSFTSNVSHIFAVYSIVSKKKKIRIKNLIFVILCKNFLYTMIFSQITVYTMHISLYMTIETVTVHYL